MAEPRHAPRGHSDDRPRPHADDRPRPHADDRPRPPAGSGPPPFQRPFRPAPRTDYSPPPPPQTLRLRDGDREIEVSGTAAFIRQVIEDIPDLWSRLHGERPAQPSAIRMPRPPADTALRAAAEES